MSEDDHHAGPLRVPLGAGCRSLGQLLADKFGAVAEV